MLRAAIYPRVSTEEQKKFGLSIYDQQNDLEKYAKAHGMKIVGVFPDAGYSARKKIEHRPAMLELLEAVKRDEVDIILVTKLDRWFRNIGEYYKVQEILEEHHVSWKTIYEDYDTSTASGRLKINIMLAVAQDEADRTSERIKKVLDAKKERNEVCTGHLPKGYKIEGKFAVIDEKLKSEVVRFFLAFLETGSVYSAIKAAPKLNLNYRSASNMLYNRGYLGDWFGINLPPYLTEEQFRQIQAMRRRPVKKTAQNRTYLFSGMLTCGECGRRMGGRPRKTKVGESYVYNCDGCYQHKGCINNANIMETTIEKYLLEHIDEKVKIAATFKANEQAARDYDAEEKAVQKKLSKLSGLYLDDLIEKDDYTRRYKELTSELEKISEEKAQRSPKPMQDLESTFFSGWQDIYKKLSRENKKSFWKLKIKEIRLYQDRRIEFDFL